MWIFLPSSDEERATVKVRSLSSLAEVRKMDDLTSKHLALWPRSWIGRLIDITLSVKSSSFCCFNRSECYCCKECNTFNRLISRKAAASRYSSGLCGIRNQRASSNLSRLILAKISNQWSLGEKLYDDRRILTPRVAKLPLWFGGSVEFEGNTAISRRKGLRRR
jgi:hypothetical protein